MISRNDFLLHKLINSVFPEVLNKMNIHLPKSNFMMCLEAYYLMFVKHFEAQNCHVSIINSRNNSSDKCYFFSLKMGSNIDWLKHLLHVSKNSWIWWELERYFNVLWYSLVNFLRLRLHSTCSSIDQNYRTPSVSPLVGTIAQVVNNIIW